MDPLTLASCFKEYHLGVTALEETTLARARHAVSDVYIMMSWKSEFEKVWW